MPFDVRTRSDGDDDRLEPAAARDAIGAALDEGGITFVKLGQLLATRRDLLPAEIVDELTALQDVEVVSRIGGLRPTAAELAAARRRIRAGAEYGVS